MLKQLFCNHRTKAGSSNREEIIHGCFADEPGGPRSMHYISWRCRNCGHVLGDPLTEPLNPLGWRDVAHDKPPEAFTLLFKSAPNNDGLEHVWLALATSQHPIEPVKWAFLPDILEDD